MTPAQLGIASKEPKPTDILIVRRERLLFAAKSLCDRLQSLQPHVANKNLAFVYFDEAHTLRNTSKKKTLPQECNPYIALMHVLSQLNDSPIFFVFLSTSSSLLIRASAPTDAEHPSPSLRVQMAWTLIPPFFELPFNIFCCDFTKTLMERNKLTLNGVCELEQMVKFGRPM
jgi:hypothetical protein